MRLMVFGRVGAVRRLASWKATVWSALYVVTPALLIEASGAAGGPGPHSILSTSLTTVGTGLAPSFHWNRNTCSPAVRSTTVALTWPVVKLGGGVVAPSQIRISWGAAVPAPAVPRRIKSGVTPAWAAAKPAESRART